MNYYIDKKVLSLLVGLVEASPAMDKLFSDYSEKIQKLQTEAMAQYMLNSGVDPSTVFEFIVDYGAVDFDPIEIDTKYEALSRTLNMEELNNFVQQKVDAYNKLVYLQFTKNLTAAQINEINIYLKQREQELNSQIKQYSKFIDEVIQEVETRLNTDTNIPK